MKMSKRLPFEESIKRAMLLVREFRLHCIAQGLDPKAVRAAIKILMKLDDHFALKKLSEKEESDLEAYANKIAGEAIQNDARKKFEPLEILASLSKENELILQEVRDHAKYWHSDMAKRITIEKHLKEKGMKDVAAKVDQLIKAGKLILIPKPRGDYLKETTIEKVERNA